MKINYSTLRAHNARNPKDDVQFAPAVVARRNGMCCCLIGCNGHLTGYKGPGSRYLCREHQLLLREYGGHARLDRQYTFWKKDHCEECGHSPMNDNPQIKKIPQPYRRILGMMMLHVDHIETAGKDKYDHQSWSNSPDNLKTLCQECHMLKTYTSGDHWASHFHG
jgi:hypothetical protein